MNAIQRKVALINDKVNIEFYRRTKAVYSILRLSNSTLAVRSVHWKMSAQLDFLGTFPLRWLFQLLFFNAMGDSILDFFFSSKPHKRNARSTNLIVFDCFLYFDDHAFAGLIFFNIKGSYKKIIHHFDSIKLVIVFHKYSIIDFLLKSDILFYFLPHSIESINISEQ